MRRNGNVIFSNVTVYRLCVKINNPLENSLTKILFKGDVKHERNKG